MAPTTPTTAKDTSTGNHFWKKLHGSKSRKDDDDVEKLIQADDDHNDDDKDVDDQGKRAIGLFRQLLVCAGLMASDCNLVFMQLAMLPCLQTLGVPVSLVTISGCLSGSLALMGLPIMGRISDGGKNPHRRKKPAVVWSSTIFVIAYSLIIGGCVVHISGKGASSGQNSSSFITFQTTSDVSFNPFNDSSYYGTSAPSSDVLQKTSPVFDSSSLQENSKPGLSFLESELIPTNGRDNEDEDPETTDQTPQDDPLGLGIPLGGLLAIVGFAFLDMGNDFNNSCLKSFILASTRKTQHVNLLVVGVMMSAVGGCVSAIFGLLDAGDFLAAVSGETEIDQVPAKTVMQCCIFVVLTITCTSITVLSAPPIIPDTAAKVLASSSNPMHTAGSKSYGSTEDQDDDVMTMASAPVDDLSCSVNYNAVQEVKDEILSAGNRRLENSAAHDALSYTTALDNSQDNFFQGDISSSSASTVLQVEDVTPRENPGDKASAAPFSILRFLQSLRLREETPPNSNTARLRTVSITEPHGYTALERSAADYDSDSDDDSFQSYDDEYDQVQGMEEIFTQSIMAGAEQFLPTNHVVEPFSCGLGRPKARNPPRSRRLVLICASMFFMAGAWQSFNICSTDFLGKVMYGGDPEADPDSESNAAYRQGTETGSRGVLMLNIAYVVVNLLQRKILTAFGPKVEHMVICLTLVGFLAALEVTVIEAVYYCTAIVFGVFRSAMYTIPFILANEICQEEAKSTGRKGGAKVGTTMALITGMLPLSYLMVSTLTGPLIYATEDPSSPIYYTIFCTATAAAVFAFT